jgi:hypothetical protein
MFSRQDMLTENEIKYLQSELPELEAIWNKQQLYRTETEMRVSVLSDVRFPDMPSKYWQCVREAASMYETLIGDLFSYRRLKLKMEKLLHKLSVCATSEDLEDAWKAEKLRIALDEARFTQSRIIREARDRVRELRLWQQLMAECVARHGKPFDTNDPDASQLESLIKRFELQWEHKGDKATPGELENMAGHLLASKRRVQELAEERSKSDIRINYKVSLLGE